MKTPLVCAASRSTSRRDGKSIGPPGGTGSSTRTVPAGHSCAGADAAASSRMPTADAAARRNRIIVCSETWPDRGPLDLGR